MILDIREQMEIILVKDWGLIITVGIQMTNQMELGAIQWTLLNDGNTVHVLELLQLQQLLKLQLKFQQLLLNAKILASIVNIGHKLENVRKIQLI